jgi:hypothetical protein
MFQVDITVLMRSQGVNMGDDKKLLADAAEYAMLCKVLTTFARPLVGTDAGVTILVHDRRPVIGKTTTCIGTTLHGTGELRMLLTEVVVDTLKADGITEEDLVEELTNGFAGKTGHVKYDA